MPSRPLEDTLEAIASKRVNASILLIGNGPSAGALIDYGLHNLPAGLDTFGMGAAYRFYEEAGWWPTYYAWCDAKVVHSHRSAFKRLVESPAIPVQQFFLSLPVSDSGRLCVTPHSSTGDFCFETAAKLGYERIFIIGVEGRYVDDLPQSRPLSDDEYRDMGFDEVLPFYAAIYKNPASAENDFRAYLRIIDRTPLRNPNYFFDSYQRKGDVYSQPRDHTHRRNWNERASRYPGLTVYNLSPDSAIEHFEKIDGAVPDVQLRE